jgi:hypothetical protein
MDGVTAIRSEFRPKETPDGIEGEVRTLERSVLRGSIMPVPDIFDAGESDDGHRKAGQSSM